ncbi:MAG: magnesium transporter CorA family protein [Nevskiales bacterium]
MLTAYQRKDAQLQRVHAVNFVEIEKDTVWIDLHNPTEDEEGIAEDALRLNLPTREEMRDIEESSRLYAENGALYMTATVPAFSDSDYPSTTEITFVLTPRCLVTVRYAEPKSFRAFASHAERQPNVCQSAESTLAGLIQAIQSRIADILERVAADNDSLSRRVLDRPQVQIKRADGKLDFEDLLRRLGRNQTLVAKSRESLMSVTRLMGFLSRSNPEVQISAGLRDELSVLVHDARSLIDHTAYLSGNINFELDAILGMLSAEQSSIIKIFTVAAVVFLPPTLVASIYGMNFDFMPELAWKLGYPFALLLMVLSVVFPYAWFKRKGWL